MEQYLGTGRRKTSVARVFLRSGTGEFTVNGRALDEYFSRQDHRIIAQQPLAVLEREKNYSIVVKAAGGGESGQAEAIRHGLARALVREDETVLKILRVHGYLTRDSRMVERKKYGQRGARRKFQFSKR
jgi:small subunit ribosomal protein S9